MADMNTIGFTGRVGREPELKYVGENPCLTFSVANGTYKKGAGDYNTLTTWYNVTVWGKRAESLANILKAKAQVAVTGRHVLRPYQDKDGNERFSNDVEASDVNLIGGKADADTTESTQEAPQRETPRTSQRSTAGVPVAASARRNTPQPVDDSALPF